MAEAARRLDPTVTPLHARLAALAAEIRGHSVAGIYHAGSGHPGGALSCADLLACLYGAELNVAPDRIADPHRDRFILSKGHAAPALYGAGAALGFVKPAAIRTLRKLGSPLQGHPHVLDLPWVETSTGSLGQGFSVALGLALGLRHKGSPARVYAMLGDGELQEGEVWETAMAGAHFRLSNLVAVIDYNKLQSDDRNAAIMGLEPLAQKWRAFGWRTQEIDGHDIAAILAAFREASAVQGQPAAIIAHTVKGKGVSWMEDAPAWHGSVKLTREQTVSALAELGCDDAAIERAL